MTANSKVWAERVALWRRSGQTSREFCEGKDYDNGRLLWWSSELNRRDKIEGVGTKATPQFARVVAVANEDRAGIVVRVGNADIVVSRGFEASLLVEVVRALGGVK